MLVPTFGPPSQHAGVAEQDTMTQVNAVVLWPASLRQLDVTHTGVHRFVIHTYIQYIPVFDSFFNSETKISLCKISTGS